ncbi:MAG: hypothetical protein EPN53_16730 [Acidobacteria bacterium]|nr:MAG: hypothetical protein EPN53_16730 [Acidobacteriota bacterium]
MNEPVQDINLGDLVAAFRLDLQTGLKQLYTLGTAMKDVENEAQASAAKVAEHWQALGEKFQTIGRGLSMFLTVPLAGAGVAVTKFASDLNESMNKAEVVFGKAAGTVTAFAANAARDLGMSTRSAIEAVGTFGNLFKAIGIGADKAAEMSTGMVKLAADLASFNNIKPEEALERLRSGIVGEVEALRTLGVNLSETTLRTEALRLGFKATGAVLDPVAKTQAAYSLIMKQTALAQGDFSRTSDQLANSTRIAKAELENAAATLGRVLLPQAAAAAGKVAELAREFNNLSQSTKDLVVYGGGVALLAGPLLNVIGKLMTLVAAGELARVAMATKGVAAAESLGGAVKLLGTATAGAVAQWVVLPAIVGAASYAVTRFLADVTGLDNVLREKAQKPLAELAAILAKDEGRFQEMRAQLEHLKTQLHLTGDEWDVNAVRSEESSRKLAVAITSATALVATGMAEQRAQIGTTVPQVDRLRGAFDQVRIALENAKKAGSVTKYIEDSLTGMYGVLNEEQAKGAAAKLAADFALIMVNGGGAGQAAEAFGPRVTDLMTKFKDLGVAVPKDLQAIADAIAEKNEGGSTWAIEQLRKKIAQDLPGDAAQAAIALQSSLGDGIRKLAEQSKGSLDNIATVITRLGTGVTDSLAKTATDATTNLQAIETEAKRITNHPYELEVNVKLNQQRLLEALQALGIETPGLDNTSGRTRP